MLKTAQKRNILNKIKEMTNVSGIAAEKFFNPEFQRVMESLREKDDQIRSIASGEAIGSGDPGNDPMSLKDLIKSSDSNLSRREYMMAVAALGRFHTKIYEITQVISTLNNDVDQVHHDFLFKDLDDESRQHLSSIKQKFSSTQVGSFVKEAGVMDFFYNIGTKRGRALAAWEKRYPKQVGKLKKDTANLQARSESLLSVVLGSLKEMAAARAVRNVDNYMKSSEKVLKGYQAYDKSFRDYYQSNIKGFLEKVDLISPTEKVDSKELGKQEISTTPTNLQLAPTEPAPPPVPTTVSPAAQIAPELMAAPPTLPAAPLAPAITQNAPPASGPATLVSPAPIHESMGPGNTEIPPANEFKSDQIAQEMWGKSAHRDFVKSLEKLAGESPILVASIIKKYARSIQDSDPGAAIQLLKLAHSL